MAPTGPPRANSDPSQPGIRSFTGAWGGLAGAEPGSQISQGRKSTCETVGRPSSSYRGRAEPSPIRARLALLARHRDHRLGIDPLADDPDFAAHFARLFAPY